VQQFEHAVQQIVLQEMILAADHARERLKRIEAAIVEFIPKWSLATVVEALQALRGIHLLTAATIMVKVRDLRRFDNPRQLMGYLGLVPGEPSTGDSVRRLGITKAGNVRVRRVLVESAWAYPDQVARKGRAWVKSGQYWLVYSTKQPPVIAAVFYDAADVPRRI
jgi:transposase